MGQLHSAMQRGGWQWCGGEVPVHRVYQLVKCQKTGILLYYVYVIKCDIKKKSIKMEF